MEIINVTTTQIINLTNNLIDIMEFCNKQNFDCRTTTYLTEETEFLNVFIRNKNNDQYIMVIITYEPNTYVLDSYSLNNSYPFNTDENINLEQLMRVIRTELV